MFKIARRFYSKNIRPFEERNKTILGQYRHRRLKLAMREDEKPHQFKRPQQEPDPKVLTRERKLPSMVEMASPYHHYTQESRDRLDKFETFYDPLFNPHLYQERDRINPDEEPFNAIYADSQSEAATDYTKVRNIATPELWEYVERLARITVAPMPRMRKAGEPIVPLPSGFVPPPETPPDLPYYVPRTRNYLLPVYYNLSSDPEQCFTIVKQVSGDLWQLEMELRDHLESLSEKKRRILTSVQETDSVVQFRGRYINEVVDWLHARGF